jgi:hypothetical protein
MRICINGFNKIRNNRGLHVQHDGETGRHVDLFKISNLSWGTWPGLNL